MKYRLGDICTIAKGATGIMKAVPGPFPMVTLAEERKQHDEYQFDAAAVIVPLISSTGHGHASIKRIHYQEGKFALGTILCAVIPKDEALLNPRYLFVYLQQFKDSVLVPLMKGAANVSLPLNKLAALEIEVPTLAKQQEVIDLAHVLTGHKNDLETLLDAQEVDTVKLRQALLREAMQGQLLPQDPTDEPAALLLKKLQAAKAATGKGAKGKAGALFAEEAGAVKGLFSTPKDWLWCSLNQIASVSSGSTPKPDAFIEKGGVPYLKMYNLVNQNVGFDYRPQYVKEEVHNSLLKRSIARPGDLLMNIVGPPLGKLAIVPETFPEWNMNQAIVMITSSEKTTNKWIYWFLREGSAIATVELKGMAGQDNISVNQTRAFPIPLPPLAEQRRIVEKLEQLSQHCDALEQRIRESRRLAEQLLQTALREALAPPAGPEGYPEEEEPALATAEASASAPSRRGRPRRPSASQVNQSPDLFGDLFPNN